MYIEQILHKQVDILISKNQALQIYLKNHVYKASLITMDRNLRKFDPHEIKQPYHTELIGILQ